MHLYFKVFIVLVFSLFSLSVQAQDTSKVEKKPLTKAEKKKAIKSFSYSYGYSFAKDLIEKSSFDSLEKHNPKQILKGIKAGLSPDSATLAKVNEHIQERLNNKDYEVTAETAEGMAYNLGYNAVGNLIQTLELPTSDFHYGWMKKGVKDYFKKKEPKYTVEVMEGKLTSYFEEKQEALMKRRQEKQKRIGKRNLAKGQKFLEENAQKEGVVALESGLQYKVLKEGTGEKPTLENTVVAHYHGTLLDGKVFDSSKERGQPAKFPLKNLIKGWQEGIPLMKVGAKYKFFVPADLAYGENGPPSIGPNQTLIFEVELLEVIKEKPSSPKKNMSYSFGYLTGQSLQKNDFSKEEVNPRPFIAGFAKGFQATKADLTEIEKMLVARMQEGVPAKSEEAATNIAYSIGYSSSANIALQLGCSLDEFDIEMVAAGYMTALSGQEPKFSQEEMQGHLQTFFMPKQQAKQAEQQKKDAVAAKVNIEAGKKFLAENAKKEGVVTTESGLQYKVLKEGTGVKPTTEDKVKTHYHGTLIDGTVFDSSVERGQPATFPVNGVIQGWQEAIPLMKVGAKYRLFIPSDLAYGMRAMGPKIPAGSTLIFEVELLEVVKEEEE